LNKSTVASNKGEKFLDRFPCAQCGAVLKYAPGTSTLVCDYCGFENHIEHRAGRIEEYDLQEALRQLSQPRTETAKPQTHYEECGDGVQYEPTDHAVE